MHQDTSGNQTQSKSLASSTAWEVIKQNKSQLFFFLLGILAIPIFISFIEDFNNVRTWMFTEFKEPEYGWPQYRDFYITGIASAVSWAIQTVMNKYTWNFFYKNCKEKNNEKVRQSKTQKSCDHFYKGFYFIIATVWGYLILKDSDFLPPYLLG